MARFHALAILAVRLTVSCPASVRLVPAPVSSPLGIKYNIFHVINMKRLCKIVICTQGKRKLFVFF
jgi:hypothetical protein